MKKLNQLPLILSKQQYLKMKKSQPRYQRLLSLPDLPLWYLAQVKTKEAQYLRNVLPQPTLLKSGELLTEEEELMEVDRTLRMETPVTYTVICNGSALLD